MHFHVICLGAVWAVYVKCQIQLCDICYEWCGRVI